jgi:hypothetical protein
MPFLDKTVILPLFITFVLLQSRGFVFTFLYWYVPVMLLVPSYLLMDAPGVPPMTYYLTAFIPFMLRPEIYRTMLVDFHWLDIPVYGFVFFCALSEQVNESFSSARQMIFLNVLYQLGPYFAVKYIILHHRKEVDLAKIVVFPLAAMAVITVYEFRMGYNVILELQRIWPVYVESNAGGVVTVPRWGFFRAQGPFVHPIIAAIVYGFGMPLGLWLFRTKQVTPFFLPLAATGLTALGLFMTFSRGPYLGAFMAVGLYLVGQSKFRVQLFIAGCVLGLMAAPGLTYVIADYMSVSRETAQSESQETVAYRKELIMNYLEFVGERPWLGHGFLNVPEVPGQPSIDNQYLLFMLNWGIPLLVMFLIMAGGAIFSLLKIGFFGKMADNERGMVWAVVGGIAGCSFTIATVYLGYPTNTLIYMWCGWASAIVLLYKRGKLTPLDSEDGEIETKPEKEPSILLQSKEKEMQLI